MTKHENGNFPQAEGRVLLPGAARALLLATGRAVESGDCVALADQPDSIARAAFGIFISGQSETLSSAIGTYASEEYAESSVHDRFGTNSETLDELSRMAIEQHALQLGMTPEEARLA